MTPDMSSDDDRRSESPDPARRRRAVRSVGRARLPTPWGPFIAYAYATPNETVHLALVHGEPSAATCLVRLHSECLTGDALASLRCDCGEQLHHACRRIAESGDGVVVYIRGHEGRGIGLGAKIRAYECQDRGHDTVDANVVLGYPVDARDYTDAAEILLDLGVGRLRLLTNNPQKVRALEDAGMQVTERVPLPVRPNSDNIEYLKTKRDRLGHLLEWPDDPEPAGDRTRRNDDSEQLTQHVWDELLVLRAENARLRLRLSDSRG